MDSPQLSEIAKALKELVKLIDESQVTSNYSLWVAIAAVIISISLLVITFISSAIGIRHNKKIRDSMYTDMAIKISAEYRNLIIQIMNNEELYIAYKGKSSDVRSRDRVGAFFVNHASNIYYAYKKSLIEKDEWSSYESDIREMFEMDCVSQFWRKYLYNYSFNFQKYIFGLNLPVLQDFYNIVFSEGMEEYVHNSTLTKIDPEKVVDLVASDMETEVESNKHIKSYCPCRRCMRNVCKSKKSH